jgi:N4-gp56 family major capsid protein
MAVTTFGLNDALAVKLWSKRMDAEGLKETYAFRFMGKSDNSLCQLMEDTEKGPGDRVRFALRMLFTGEGRTENQTLEGNEESLTTYYDEFFINELVHAGRHRSETTIDMQRIPYDIRDIIYSTLKDWWLERLDVSFMNQLAGNTAQTNVKYTGMQATTAPSSTRLLRAVAAATDEALTSGNVFLLNLIDRAVTKAKTASPVIRPVKHKGQNKYVLFVHPYQVYALRADVSTVGNWFDLQKARLQGGESVESNGIYSGAIGEYNNTVIHESTRVPLGVHSTTGAAVASTRRAIFCGAQALSAAFGMKNSKGKYTWVEEKFDYNREMGISAGTIFGMKKAVFNSVDYATITITTYAAEPA